MRWFMSSLAILALTIPTQAEDRKAEKVAEGQPAPDIQVEAATATGTRKVSLADFKNKKNVVLL